MADQTFGAEESPLLLALPFFGFAAFFVAAAVGIVADGEQAKIAGIPGVVAVVVGWWGVYMLLYVPHRATLTDEGVVLRAWRTERRIPWRDLDAVHLRIVRRGTSSLWWRPRGPRPIQSAVLEDVGRLFAEIGRRSPETTLS